MRKIILSVYVTLDGFVAGPKGEMDGINCGDGLYVIMKESVMFPS